MLAQYPSAPWRCSVHVPEKRQSFAALTSPGRTLRPTWRRPTTTDRRAIPGILRAGWWRSFLAIHSARMSAPPRCREMAQVKQLLGEDGGRLQVIFVTVDPDRDTPEVLKAYMASFDPGFLAL